MRYRALAASHTHCNDISCLRVLCTLNISSRCFSLSFTQLFNSWHSQFSQLKSFGVLFNENCYLIILQIKCVKVYYLIMHKESATNLLDLTNSDVITWLNSFDAILTDCDGWYLKKIELQKFNIGCYRKS